MVKARIQICSVKNAILFISTCKSEGLFPTFVRFRVAIPRLADTKLIQQCRQNILEDELKFKKRLLGETSKHVIRLDRELKQTVSHIVYVRLLSIAEEIVQRKIRAIEMKHQSKLSNLREQKIRQENLRKEKLRRLELRYTTRDEEDAPPVRNLSKYVLSDNEHNALINGLSHVYPSERFDQPRLACNMEYFYARLLNLKTSYRHYESKPANEIVPHNLTPSQLSGASEIREVANSFQRKAQSDLKKIGVKHRETLGILRSLAKNKSIIITRPDKGRGVVLMDRADYVQKMNVILGDRSTFTLIDYDPTIENENRLITLLLDLKKKGFISETEYSLARPRGSRPARIYGLPKMHKKDNPLRPVMSATKTVSYGLGKMLQNRINHLRNSPYTVKDTFDFVKKIKASEYADKVMVSFDVKSLFTNVPLSYTIDLILNKKYPTCPSVCESQQKSQQKSQLCIKCRERRDFESLLRIATSETHFIFDNKMYVQNNGVAMGAPLAPVIADIFMAHLEETLMSRLVENGVLEWHRYVDDTFILMEPTADVDRILDILNSFHRSINFTHEPSTEQSLPFLDVNVTRSIHSSKFETSVYRKPSFTGLMIKWDSFVPIQYKKASIVNMIRRALAVCSTYTLLAAEFNEIRRLGLKNGYPLSFIDTRLGIGLSNFLKKKTKSDTVVIGCEKQRLNVEIPYIGPATYQFKKKLSRISAKVRPDLDVCFFTKPIPSVQSFFNIKDPIPKHLQADIVYSVKCNDCDDIYVGKTQRQAARRLWEHGAPKTLFEKHNLLSLGNTTDNDPDDAHYDNIDDTHTGQNNVGPIKNKPRNKTVPYPDTPFLRRSARLRSKQLSSDQLNIASRYNIQDTTKKKENTEPTVPQSLSAPYRHEKQKGHRMNWDGFNVVWQDSHPYKLLVRESLVIKAHEPSLNRTTHSIPLAIFSEGLPRKVVPDPNRTS